MGLVSVIIPALNEERGIGDVIKEVPIKALKQLGYEVEILVIDNGSHDRTPTIARESGATVIVQPIRGYGNAYKAGFANAHGEIVATGDADQTYPFSVIPDAIVQMQKHGYDFVNTDRLRTLRPGVMEASHIFGNHVLTAAARLLFGWPFHDSQSGMWIFRRDILDALDVRSSGMPFSQELKIEAYARGFKCAEVPIDYRARAGDTKLNVVRDGWGNMTQLFRKRLSYGISLPAKTVARAPLLTDLDEA